MSALVIGGGLAGAGIATLLARQGRAVTLIEREPGAHDKVCGEFLSGEAVDILRGMGVDPEALGARPIERVAIFHGARGIETALPFGALGVSRRVLDEALLTQAAAAGARVRRGVRAVGLEREGAGGFRAALADGETLAADEVFLATGKHDLRGWKRTLRRPGDMVGFKLYLDPSPAVAARLAGAVELHLFPGGYAGLDLVEDGRANLCLVVRKAAFAKAGGDFPALLATLRARCPALAERLNAAAPATQRPLAVAAIPYGYLADDGEPGLWRLGDQAAVIPSLVGDGMAMALHGAQMAAAFAAQGRGAPAFQRAFARAARRQMRMAGLAARGVLSPVGQPLAAGLLSLAPGLAALTAKVTRSALPPSGGSVAMR